ncbi:hypothetical protein BV22DRAFT_1003526 [Leucogyrophana mollusca]|uniref:Uncharacterized protein n=1 Tax=Leucogyrophana mollusca TaxID=85980 RepID=A0ACB8BUT0_9AGAM|nr:hypothetical protein BV22DRAFT_1003526 [Leucogyrophana mollusca]
MTGGDESLRALTFRAIVSATMVGGEMYVAVDKEHGRVVGTACWYPPGSDCLVGEEQTSHPDVVAYFEELEGNHPALAEWFGNTLMKTMAEVATRAYGDPDYMKDKSWGLYSWAVHPAYQHKKIGTKLMAVGEALARKDRVPVCLGTESESQVRMYKQLGFELKGEGYIPPPAIDGIEGFTTYPMAKFF